MAMATRVKVILESKHFDAVPTREVSDRNSSDNSAQTHRHTEDDGGFAAPFSSLLNRVKLMESDFSDDNIPERHLYLLRDIRVRVTELEKAVTREYTQKKENWESEKRSLLQQLREKTSLAEEIKIAQEEGFKKLRKRYEDALSAAEEALATNTTAAKHEVERLEELLHKNTRDSSESVGSHRNKDDKSSVLTNNTMTEYVKLQQLLDKATDELESSKEKLRTVENQRANEINTLRTHFARFRRAQAEVVQSLEDQLEDMRSQSITVGGSSSALDSYQSLVSGTVSSIAEAEDKLRRLAYRYHMKSVELDAVMRYIYKIIKFFIAL